MKGKNESLKSLFMDKMLMYLTNRLCLRISQIVNSHQIVHSHFDMEITTEIVSVALHNEYMDKT